jgi:hypothetical protein
MKLESIETTGWTVEQKDRLRELVRRQEDLDRKKALMAAEDEARKASPEELLAQEEERAEAEAREVELRGREREGDAVYREAVRKAGSASLVGRIRTEEGPIVLRGMGGEEMEALAKRLKPLSEDDQERVSRDALLDCVLYPDRPRMDALVLRYPGLWSVLRTARDSVATAGAELAGKGA